jgi:hypothetical protein
MHSPLAFAIIGHMVGDYLLQTDWMANNKKKSSFACAVHCLLWTASVTLFARWWTHWWLPVALFVTHFAQDRTQFIRWYMNHMGQKGFSTPPLAPWSMIVVDNTFHLVVLAVLAMLVEY